MTRKNDFFPNRSKKPIYYVVPFYPARRMRKSRKVNSWRKPYRLRKFSKGWTPRRT